MYCTNCGKRLNNGDVYCTSCGTKNNYQNDYNNFNKDNNYSLLLIVSILFPIAGIIFYVIYRKKYKKAKNYLIASLIAIALKIVVIFIAICLNLFLFDNFNYDIIDSIDSIDDVDDYIDEDNEIVEFNYYLFSYVILAGEKFRSDDVSSACYDIDDLKNSLKYDGSIEISNVSGELVIMVWFTDGKYYVDSLNFDDYKIDKIMKGNFINKTCSINNFNNSL